MHIALIMRDRYPMCDTRHASIEEQLAMFLYVIEHNTKNIGKSNFYDLVKLLVGALMMFYVPFVAFEMISYNLQDVVAIQT